MTKEQINKLQLDVGTAGPSGQPELIETHISWVLLAEHFVYKIKKPIQYSFLDFSTLEKRKYYCERELELNRRLTEDIYLDVQAIREWEGGYFIGGEKGGITDYAVTMRKLDRNRQMDALLLNNQVTQTDMNNLAKKIAHFHKHTQIIYQKDYLDVQKLFIDLDGESAYLHDCLGAESSAIIHRAVENSNRFIENSKALLANRLNDGFFRDCHGDLHSRNIFLLPSPQPFDCLEFNDDYRQIDVLNEIAFLCMDLDAFGRPDLGEYFLKCYNELFPCINSEEDRLLFVYYKSYRSNIRAKVNSLRLRDAKGDTERSSLLAETDKYLRLLDGYIKMIGSQ